MPKFDWQPPNIRALPGAEWTARHRVYLPLTDDTDRWEPGLLAATGCTPAVGWKIPGGPGDEFYKYLRRHYHRGPNGDYQQ